MRVIGLDPGLQRTGWGILDARKGQSAAIACGVVSTAPNAPLAERLSQIYRGLTDIVQRYRPEMAAVEETFVNSNPASTLKLGHARAVALLVPALAGLEVHEYAAKLVKKSLVGSGNASKEQMVAMVQRLLPGLDLPSADAADALGVALCHVHHAQTAWSNRSEPGLSKALVPTMEQARDSNDPEAFDPEALAALVERVLPGCFCAGAIAGQPVALMNKGSRLVVETEGRVDARRQAKLSLAGYRLLRIWPGDVLERPLQVIARIRAALADMPEARGGL